VPSFVDVAAIHEVSWVVCMMLWALAYTVCTCLDVGGLDVAYGDGRVTTCFSAMPL